MLRVEFFERWGLAIALGAVVVLFVAYRAFLASDSVKASLPVLRAAAELAAARASASAEIARIEAEDRAWWKRRAEQAAACRARGGEPINQMGPDLFCIKKECVSQ